MQVVRSLPAGLCPRLGAPVPPSFGFLVPRKGARGGVSVSIPEEERVGRGGSGGTRRPPAPLPASPPEHDGPAPARAPCPEPPEKRVCGAQVSTAMSHVGPGPEISPNVGPKSGTLRMRLGRPAPPGLQPLGKGPRGSCAPPSPLWTRAQPLATGEPRSGGQNRGRRSLLPICRLAGSPELLGHTDALTGQDGTR
ncbi:basic proline-rich protein-like [Leopardus geoffroyi]|uniref:basic proline-rich protein-like n=1 Tax=Leopardus geoffroyi TaxID=46844 RepID=UPI001E26443D|nr:basic proline-rich protein-like [Leopardus geoffroyi]